MRPQTAMAAVFLVMIGTSVLLLRGKSARAPLGDGVTVTEQGTPAPAAPPDMMRNASEPIPQGAFAQAPSPATEERPQSALPRSSKGAPSPATHGVADSLAFNQERDDAPDERFHAALRSYRAGRFDDAARAFESLPSSDPNAPDLWAARSVRDGKGCRAAVGRFDKAVARHRRTTAGSDALLEGALCYRALGDSSAARSRLTQLLDVDSHRDRARAELEQLEQLQQASGAEVGAAAPAKTAARAKSAAGAAPAAPAAPAAAAEAPASAPADATGPAPAATPPPNAEKSR
jgi:tetratricopeptide (TPR) repeat protein